MNFTLPGKVETRTDLEKLETLAEAPLAAVAAVQKAHPQLLVQEYGDASQQKALGAKERADEAKSMQFSMVGTLLILLLAFGAAVAAGVPLLLGVSLVRGHHGPARPGQPAQPAARGRRRRSRC